jgi:hypothetical protein
MLGTSTPKIAATCRQAAGSLPEGAEPSAHDRVVKRWEANGSSGRQTSDGP